MNVHVHNEQLGAAQFHLHSEVLGDCVSGEMVAGVHLYVINVVADEGDQASTASGRAVSADSSEIWELV